MCNIPYVILTNRTSCSTTCSGGTRDDSKDPPVDRMSIGGSLAVSWRWGESNPRPNVPPNGLYKLSHCSCIRNGADQRPTFPFLHQLCCPPQSLALCRVSPCCYKHLRVKSGTFKACTSLLLRQQERILRRKRLRLLSWQFCVLLVLGVGAPLATAGMTSRQSKPIHPPNGDGMSIG